MNNIVIIPRWITYYTIFLALLGFGAAAIGYFAPGIMFSNIKIDFSEVSTITGMFGARNLAFGVLAAMCLVKKDISFYLFLFTGRIIIEIQDILVIISTHALPLPWVAIAASWLIFFIVPEFLAIKSLNKLK
ncbi:MAG: hypothetical protein H6550_04425 [Chitinophagales bacterium]|nr:hypothetical protein [Chitinophagales bacterium]